MVDIGGLNPPPNYNYTIAVGINASGEIAGYGYHSMGVEHAFYWNGSIHDLAPDGPSSQASGIDAHGNVYGNNGSPYIWNGSFFTVPDPPGGTQCQLEGFNDARDVVGLCVEPPNALRAFIFRNGKSTLFGPLNGDSEKINDDGDLILDSPIRFYLLEEKPRMRVLLQNHFVPDNINENGVVVGEFELPGVNHAAFFDGTNYTDVGTLPGFSSNSLSAMNSRGEAVGIAFDSYGQRAIYWNRSIGLIDLNSLIDPRLGIQLTDAQGINDRGQIVANGLNGCPVNCSRGNAYLLTQLTAGTP